MDISTIDCLIVLTGYLFTFGFAVIFTANKRLKRKKTRR